MGEPTQNEGWALRAAEHILSSWQDVIGCSLLEEDRLIGRQILGRLMVRERLIGLTRENPGPAWIYRVVRHEDLCPECGLAYSDHPLDPEDSHLTLTCCEDRVICNSAGEQAG